MKQTIEAHPLQEIKIRGRNKEEVRRLLTNLPTDIFSHSEEFRHGIPYATNHNDITIYAKKEPSLGKKGIMLVVVNEHLYGDPHNTYDTPFFRIPEGATDILFVPSREPPRANTIYSAVHFTYQGTHVALGFECRENSLEKKLTAGDNR